MIQPVKTRTPLRSRWQDWHNLLLCLFCVGGFWMLIRMLLLTGIASLHPLTAYHHLLWLGGLSLCLDMVPMQIYLYRRRKQEGTGQGFRTQPGDARVTLGLLLLGLSLWSLIWAGLLGLNHQATAASAVWYTVSRRSSEPKTNTTRLWLTAQAGAPAWELELRRSNLGLTRDDIAIGDRLELALEEGRLGFDWISHLAWQPKGSHKTRQLWPRL